MPGVGSAVMDEGELKKTLERNDTAAVEKALLSGDLKPGQRLGRDGFTLMHWACYYGRTEVINKRSCYTACRFHAIPAS